MNATERAKTVRAYLMACRHEDEFFEQALQAGVVGNWIDSIHVFPAAGGTRPGAADPVPVLPSGAAVGLRAAPGGAAWWWPGACW